jgi:hypothetical protein
VRVSNTQKITLQKYNNSRHPSDFSSQDCMSSSMPIKMIGRMRAFNRSSERPARRWHFHAIRKVNKLRIKLVALLSRQVASAVKTPTGKTMRKLSMLQPRPPCLTRHLRLLQQALEASAQDPVLFWKLCASSHSRLH